MGGFLPDLLCRPPLGSISLGTGSHALVSLLLVLIIIGLNFMTVMNQIKAHAARVEFQRSLTKDFERGTQETEMKKE